MRCPSSDSPHAPSALRPLPSALCPYALFPPPLDLRSGAEAARRAIHCETAPPLTGDEWVNRVRRSCIQGRGRRAVRAPRVPVLADGPPVPGRRPARAATPRPSRGPRPLRTPHPDPRRASSGRDAPDRIGPTRAGPRRPRAPLLWRVSREITTSIEQDGRACPQGPTRLGSGGTARGPGGRRDPSARRPGFARGPGGPRDRTATRRAAWCHDPAGPLRYRRGARPA